MLPFFLVLFSWLSPNVDTGFIPSSEASIQWLSPQDQDLGIVQKGEVVNLQFSYQNKSDAPVLIDNVRTSCGCTAPDWSREPLLPNDSTELRIVFQSQQVGYFRKKIKVYFSQIKKAEILYIEGELVE